MHGGARSSQGVARQAAPSLAAHAQVFRNDSQAGRQGPQRTAAPVGFHLTWREAAADGATLWEPQPPRGFRALGAVASPTAAPPGRGEVLCVAQGRTTEAGLFEAALWHVQAAALQVRRPLLPAWACLLLPLCLLFHQVAPRQWASSWRRAPALLALLLALVRPLPGPPSRAQLALPASPCTRPCMPAL